MLKELLCHCGHMWEEEELPILPDNSPYHYAYTTSPTTKAIFDLEYCPKCWEKGDSN